PIVPQAPSAPWKRTGTPSGRNIIHCTALLAGSSVVPPRVCGAANAPAAGSLGAAAVASATPQRTSRAGSTARFAPPASIWQLEVAGAPSSSTRIGTTPLAPAIAVPPRAGGPGGP